MISGQMSGATGLKDKKKRRKANVLAAPAPSKKNNKKKGAKLNKNDAKEEKFDTFDDLVFAYMITRSHTLVLSLSRDLFAFFLLIHSLAQLRFHVFICVISHTHVFYLF